MKLKSFFIEEIPPCQEFLFSPNTQKLLSSVSVTVSKSRKGSLSCVLLHLYREKWQFCVKCHWTEWYISCCRRLSHVWLHWNFYLSTLYLTPFSVAWTSRIRHWILPWIVKN